MYLRDCCADMSADAMLAGGFGGVCLAVVGAPFDLVKVRQQAAPGVSALVVIRSILRKEGLNGLFRGLGPPLLVAVPTWAVVFWAFDASRGVVRTLYGTASGEESIFEIALAGSMVAFPTSFIYCPVDRVKCLYQLDGSQGQPARYSRGYMECMRGIWHEGGVNSLFRGFRATLARDVPAWAVYFAVYAAAKRALAVRSDAAVLDGRSTFTPFVSLCAGGLAGMCTWAVAIPFDTVKTWRQTGTERTYAEACRARMARPGGGWRWGALFSGFGAIVIGGLPRDAACLCGAEAAHRALALGRSHGMPQRRPSRSSAVS